jgi:hypothetical protein
MEEDETNGEFGIRWRAKKVRIIEKVQVRKHLGFPG